jgi:PIN domain nuclease of toxin-antitoxin system
LGLLLDTNVIIWLGHDDLKLKSRIRSRLLSGQDELYVSVVSAWEYGQKQKIRPQELPLNFDEIIAAIPHSKLDLVFDLHQYALSLPLIHRDPFDRMLIAQALHHDLTLVTSDTDIHKYPIKTLW